MAWDDRLQQAAYESPSGVRITFAYENVSQSFVKHTTAFEFPGADGTLVQDLGKSGLRLPLRMIFSGPDHDLESKKLMGMLGERGVGILEHPAYGSIAVVPFGRVVRRDALTTAANQSVVETIFFQTNTVEFPVDVESPADDTLEAIADYNEVAPVEFQNTVSTDKVLEDVSVGVRIKSGASKTLSALSKVASATAVVEARLVSVLKSINSNVDTFVGDPLALAFQISILVQLPARSGALIVDRLEAYSNLLTSLTFDVHAPGVDSQSLNSFFVDDLFASSAVVGAAAATLSADFTTRPEAIGAADSLLSMLDALNTWRDANLVSLGVVDIGGTYQTVLDVASSAAGFLVQVSFSLKQEREFTLVAPRTPINLEAELYGTVDTNLDFLITSNALVGDEIFEVPIGRRIVYYV